MSTYIAELEMSISPAPPETTERVVADDVLSPEPPFGIARGIITAVLLAIPFWALFAFALYLLI
jgi:hypothetical protein